MIKRNWREVRPVVGTHDDAIVWHIFCRKDRKGGTLAPEAAWLPVMEKQTYIVKHAIQAGRTSNKHSHETEEQLFYILKGRGVLRVGEEEAEVREGDFIYLPPKVPHQITNEREGEEWLEYLVISVGVDAK